MGPALASVPLLNTHPLGGLLQRLWLPICDVGLDHERTLSAVLRLAGHLFLGQAVCWPQTPCCGVLGTVQMLGTFQLSGCCLVGEEVLVGGLMCWG